MQTQWAIDIKAQCDEAGVPFFGKQRSGPKNELPLLIRGREWKAMPAGFDLEKQPPIVAAGQKTLGV
jgi:protein gp37